VNRAKRWQKRLFTLLLFLLVYFAIRSYQLSGYTEGQAPLFSAISIENRIINLHDYRGKPVLIYFWATWCPVCKMERSTIEGLAEDYAVITVASWSDDVEAVHAYFDSPGLRNTTILDLSGQLAGRYGVTGVPSFFILDKNGEIRFTERGYTTSIGLRLRMLLANVL
jgi:thiol-disulfide isomerase/thioredoxin